VVVVEQANRRTVRSDVDIILCDMFAHIGGEGADPRGLSNQEIAEAIFLSINSVKTYIRTAYRKIGVTRRQLAVIWALQHGFTAEIRRAPVHPNSVSWTRETGLPPEKGECRSNTHPSE
jgi:hypothetical protein